MAVKVYITHSTNPQEHATGNYVTVIDGHLYVLARGDTSFGSVVATYSPGHWVRAEVDRTAPNAG